MLRRLLDAIVRAAPTCCGQPMQPGTGIGSVGGWYCVVNPNHTKG
ncbi:hypothetical protein [Streptomonospora sediminis]